MKRRRGILLGLILVLLLAGAVSRRFRPDRGAEVRVEEVTKREVVATITAIGKLRARSQVNISSDVMGRVVDLNVAEGEDVEPGQVLLTIDPRQVEAAVARARATLSQAESQVTQQRANLAQSEREVGRLKELRAAGIVTEQELETAETRVEIQASSLVASLHGVAQARAALEEAEDQFARTTVRAPIAGRIVRLNIKAGETAVTGTMNNPGSLLLTIADLSGIEAVMTFDETDIPKVSVGDSAVVEIDAFPDRTFAARVASIATSAGQSGSGAAAGGSVNFEVILTLLGPTAELRPDLSATADIIVARRIDAIAVPIIAVTTRDARSRSSSAMDPETEDVPPSTPSRAGSASRGNRQPTETGVFVVRDGRAVWTPVKYGITGQGHFEILSGVAVGDVVVSGPYQTIRTLADGDPVRVRPAP